MKGSDCLAEFTGQPHHFDRTSCSETSKKVSKFYNSIQSAVDGKFQDKLEYFVWTTNSPQRQAWLVFLLLVINSLMMFYGLDTPDRKHEYKNLQ